MVDEAIGLIERAAALLRRQEISQDETHAEIRRPGQLSDSGARVRPMPSDIGESEDLHPIRIFRAMLRRKFTLIGSTSLCFTAAAAVIFTMTPHYIAESLVVVGNRDPHVARVEIKSEDATARMLPDPETVQTEVVILQSRSLAAQVADDLRLGKRPEFNPSIAVDRPDGVFETARTWIASTYTRAREVASNWFGASAEGASQDILGSNTDDASERNRAVDFFLSKLTVAVKPNSRVISVQFEDRDPQLAAAAVNTLTDHYILNQVETSSLNARNATQWLDQTVVELRERVAKSDQEFQQFRARFESQGGREFLDRKMAEENSQMATAGLSRKEIEARLMHLKELLGRNIADYSTGEVANSLTMQGLRQRAAELNGQLAQLATALGENHPKITNVRAAIAKTNEEMRAEVTRLVTALEADLRVAATKEESLRRSVATSKDEIARSSDNQVKLNSLKAEAASNRAVLEAFLTRLNETRGAAAKPLLRADAEIISHASVPQVPAKPRTKVLLAIAAVGSIMAGLGITLTREKADENRTFRSGEQIEIETGTRNLALVPLTHNPKGPQDEVLAFPASLYGEAVRGLYMALVLRQKFRILVVTSARPGEGKTTLAISLALIAAQAGRKVLLVDADLCRGGATQAFGLAGHHGLAEIISGERPFSEVVAKAGASSNFHFLASGQQSSAIAARSVLESAATLFHRLRDDYELIIIDTPPILVVSDAMALSAQADATLFAVRWGATPRAAVKLGLGRLLRSSAGSIAGIVLTMVNPRMHSRYHFADSAFYTKELLGYHRIT